MKFGKLFGLFIIFILSLSILPLNAIDNISTGNISNSSSNIGHLNANSKIHTITPYDSIQEVIDNANDGDIIELTGNEPDSDYYDGLYYYSDIKVNKKLVIRAAPNAHPIITIVNFSDTTDYYKNVDGFIITADGVELNGLKITGVRSKYYLTTPISIRNCQNVVVNNCTIHDVYTKRGAISISNSFGGSGFNNITNCKFYNNANDCVIMTFGSNNIVSDCIFTNNKVDYGVVHIIGYDNIVKNCLISNNGGFVPGIFIGDDTDPFWSINGNNVTGCTITNNKCDTGWGAVSIFSSQSSNFINNNRIFNNSRDLTLYSLGSEYNNVDANWWGDNTVGNKSNRIPKNNYVVSVEPGFDKNNFVLNYKLKLNDSSNLNGKIPAFDGCVYVNDKLNQTFDASINHEFAFNPGENVKIVVDNYVYDYRIPFKEKDVYVDQVNGDDDNFGTKDKPIKNIDTALYRVEDKGTIHLLSDFNLNEPIIINKNVTINSDKIGMAVLNGNYKNRIMLINPDLNVNLNYLSFKNGYSADDGAGIANNKSNLFINNCVFENNVADGFGGGAISSNEDYNYSKSLSSTLTSDKLNMGNNLGISFNDPRSSLDTKLIIFNSTFIKNHAANGSAICSLSSKLNISNSSFVNNTFDGDTNTILAAFQGCNLTNNSFEFDWDKINSNIIYTNLLLFQLDSSHTKGKYLRQGLVCPSQEDINNYNKNGYCKIYYNNDKKHYIKCLDMDNASADDSMFFTAKGDINIKYNRDMSRMLDEDTPPVLDATPLIAAGTEAIEDNPECCLIRFARNHPYLTNIIRSVILGVLSGFIVWLSFEKSSYEDTTTTVDMPTMGSIGDTIPIKINVKVNGENIPSGDYPVIIDGETETLHFDGNGNTIKNYIINSSKISYPFTVKFNKYKYKDIGANKYYYGASSWSTTVNWGKDSTLTTISSYPDSCNPGDNINLTFKVLRLNGQPIDSGDYNVGIREGIYPEESKTIRFNDDGIGSCLYTIKSDKVWQKETIAGAFIDCYKYYGSSGTTLITIEGNSLYSSYNLGLFNNPNFNPFLQGKNYIPIKII
ncbi:MAG: right-handed parallel beta-helix repeat-containing protein [Methanobrevibacter sp.]|jgi:hypothetical protein|nr:right-handed parallel beta-helix repeat-containing protein [Candidatus Methanovirga procula]